mgnify:CR=1 FL=1
MNSIKIIGAGLAGCEAAYQLANRGVHVELYEMRPKLLTPAHKTGLLAEIVCSNSLGSENKDDRITAAGILKEELTLANSLILSCARASRVPAGGALAVDREKFSGLITEKITSHEKLNKKSAKYGFQVKSSQNGIYMMPTINGKAIEQEEFDKLDDETKQNFEDNFLAKSEDGVTVTALSKEIDGKYKYLINDRIKEMTSSLEGSGITLKLPIGKTNYLETGYRWKAIFKLVTLLLILIEIIIGILLAKRAKEANSRFMTVYLVAVILTVILFIASILITR